MTVTYCKDCNRFFISEVSYEYYRKKYGAIIGNIKLEHSNVTYNGEFLAEESPLHLCGYNVNQQDNYSREERRFIISKIIDRGIMSKYEVINYLEYFISHNGQQSRNRLALVGSITKLYRNESCGHSHLNCYDEKQMLRAIRHKAVTCFLLVCTMKTVNLRSVEVRMHLS